MEYSNLLIDKYARKQEITFEQAIANYNTNHPDKLPVTTENVYGELQINSVTFSSPSVQLGVGAQTGDNVETIAVNVSTSQDNNSKHFAQVSGKKYEVTLTNGKINVSKNASTDSATPTSVELGVQVANTSIATASVSGSTITVTGTNTVGNTTLSLLINGEPYTAQNLNVVTTSQLNPGDTSLATRKDNYIDTAGKTATVPKGYTVSNIEGEKLISQGLVIRKDSNEYVWIEVPRTGGPDYSAVASTSVDSDAYYTAIENALIAYAGFATDGSYGADAKTKKMGWKDEWYDSSSHTYDGTTWHNYNGVENTSYSGNLEATNGCGLTYEAYNTQYKKMLKSVYTNGGFWIGRYEASAGTNAPLSQANLATQTKTCSQAQIEAAKVATSDSTNTNSANYTSSLMFGVQWDLVCKFLEGSTEWPVEHEASWYIKTDSTSWGNYSGQGGKKNTGVSGYKRMNIYDFAGNQWEWTLEHVTSFSYVPCTTRGGNYNLSGWDYPASYRYVR